MYVGQVGLLQGVDVGVVVVFWVVVYCMVVFVEGQQGFFEVEVFEDGEVQGFVGIFVLFGWVVYVVVVEGVWCVVVVFGDECQGVGEQVVFVVQMCVEVGQGY